MARDSAQIGTVTMMFTDMVGVGTYRATELGEAHDLQALLANISREESVTRLDLAGLNEHEVTLLLGKITGQELDEEGQRLAHAIQRETAGNPVFIRELVRNLDQSGRSSQRADAWSATRSSFRATCAT